MKRALWSALGTAVVFLFSGCTTEAVRPQGYLRGEAIVRSVTGGAEVTVNNHDWQPARRSLVLTDGDQARTGANGQIEFDLGVNGGKVTLMPESMLIFEQIGPTGSDPAVVAVLHLVQGRIIGDTLKPPAERKIVVKTPEGIREVH